MPSIFGCTKKTKLQWGTDTSNWWGWFNRENPKNPDPVNFWDHKKARFNTWSLHLGVSLRYSRQWQQESPKNNENAGAPSSKLVDQACELDLLESIIILIRVMFTNLHSYHTSRRKIPWNPMCCWWSLCISQAEAESEPGSPRSPLSTTEVIHGGFLWGFHRRIWGSYKNWGYPICIVYRNMKPNFPYFPL